MNFDGFTLVHRTSVRLNIAGWVQAQTSRRSHTVSSGTDAESACACAGFSGLDPVESALAGRARRKSCCRCVGIDKRASRARWGVVHVPLSCASCVVRPVARLFLWPLQAASKAVVAVCAAIARVWTTPTRRISHALVEATFLRGCRRWAILWAGHYAEHIARDTKSLG